MQNKISLPVKSFKVQVYFDGEPLSTKIRDDSLGVEIGLTPTHASYDMITWLPILTARVPATHAPGAPNILVTAEHDAPVWVEAEAHCGECQEITHQEGWRLATGDDAPDVVTRCTKCGYYNWYHVLNLDSALELMFSNEYVALRATPLGKVAL